MLLLSGDLAFGFSGSEFPGGLPFLLHTGFCEPPVAVFAYDIRQHIVRQFDPLRAVVFLEP